MKKMNFIGLIGLLLISGSAWTMDDPNKALFEAIEKADLAQIEQLIPKANINTVNEFGFTPLGAATDELIVVEITDWVAPIGINEHFDTYKEIITKLIEDGADIDKGDMKPLDILADRYFTGGFKKVGIDYEDDPSLDKEIEKKVEDVVTNVFNQDWEAFKQKYQDLYL